LHNECGDISVFGMLNHFALNIDGPDWTHFGALATGSATAGFSPQFIFIHNDLRVPTAEFKV